VPAAALDAEFSIYENGTGYSAAIELQDADRYQFNRPGLLGEPVPTTVRDIRLTDASGSVSFEQPRDSEITFAKGDYLLRYEGDIEGNSFSAVLHEPYNVTVHLPSVFNIKNPLLGYVSRGGSSRIEDNKTIITWESTRYVEIRYYDEIREIILIAFGTIWIALMIILLFGYYSMRAQYKE